ncbi:blast:Microtubule-associated protein futsch [Drosophila guanche]|uniref:Blast:Microtubule-associated protein futsch n=1 Tax=Drosophila guanche TaxID=7266 RepID=A0A3B0J911_DROGU|nr:blast:Microtubule-associated protein futsch [Drosophila guanche]
MHLKLRQPPPTKEHDQTAPSTTRNSLLKRRISFSGKKSVREFVNTEEPHYWDNSYELSDHTNGEDSREKASNTCPSHQMPMPMPMPTPTPIPTAQKENIPEHQSTQIESTLNIRTSLDVPMLTCETNRNARNSTQSRESLYAESFSLSCIGRDKLKDALYNHRVMDKTIDLMHISSKLRDDCSLELSTFEKEHLKTQPTKSGGDSFMDITPIGFAAPLPVPVPAAVAPVPVPAAATQSFMDLEQEFLNCSNQHLTTKAKENVNAAQKSEESRAESQRQADISFDCDMNVSDARDRLAANGSFGAESNNSTINYMGDESVLIPFDMISGKNISKKLTFRQLNDELEAGKIKVLVNGPRTPTDRSSKQRRFWHGLEQQDQDQEPMGINIRSIKPRGTLNFSENMTMSPLALTTPVAPRVAVPLPREKLQLPADDKRKYRLSQADELMLDNTNFLAHAKLGDETQSRNNSKSFTRRETTYENSELDLGLPSREDFPAPKHSKPRQTICQPTAMDQEEAAAAAMPPVRSCARRTLHMNESMAMEQEATTQQQRMKGLQVVQCVREEIVCQYAENIPSKGNKSKRRETLLMQQSMDEDTTSPPKELPTIGRKSKPRQTLHLEEPLEKDETVAERAAPEPATVEKPQPMEYQRSKARQTILQAEPIEVEAAPPALNNVPQQPAPVWVGSKTKRRETLLMQESMEEDIISPLKELHIRANAPMTAKSKAKPRHTLHLAEPLEEDDSIPQTVAATGATRKYHLQQPEPVEEQQPMGYHRTKARQTILQAEPIEEDAAPIRMDKSAAKQRGKSRQTLLAAEPIEEEPMLQHPSAGQQRTKSRHTLLMSEPIEEDTNQAREEPRLTSANKENLPMEEDLMEELETRRIDQSTVYRSYKSRHTLVMSEPIEEDRTKAPGKDVPSGFRRQTLLMAEPIEEETCTKNTRESAKKAVAYKSRNTLLMAEPIEEERTKEQPVAPGKDVPSGLRRQTLLMAEPIEEETWMRNTRESAKKAVDYKSRNTLLMAEPIEEERTKEPPVAPMKDVASGLRRQTLLMAEPIEEETCTAKPRNTRESAKKSVARNTLLTAESIVEDRTKEQSLAPVKAALSGYRRQTLLMAEPIEEETCISKPRNTRESAKKSVVIEQNVAALKPSKASQTLLMGNSMEEEDREEAKPHEKSTKMAPNRGSRGRAQQTMIMSESMEEDDDDFQSPLQSLRAPLELLPITPMQKQNRSASGNSMNEFEEFEEETNESAAALGPLQASLRRKRSIYHSVRMELEGEKSAIGTPKRHSAAAKRLPAHLTPNLPESKKRNTHLFANSKMMEEDQELSMDLSRVSLQEVANKTRIPLENFNESVQPVRDVQSDRFSRKLNDDPDVMEVQPPPQATVFEGRPITISDVSAYFQSQAQQVQKEPTVSATEPEQELEEAATQKEPEQEHMEQRNSGYRDSGSSTDRTFKSYAPTNQKFINLSGDTTIFAAALVENIDMDEPETNKIENVRLSLVSTLADEPDTDDEAMPAEPQAEPEPCQEQKESSRMVAAGSSASCRKCANCRRSINETKLSNDSFVLPSLPQWGLTREIEMLQRVRQRPNLDDVHEYWQIKEQERQTNALEQALDEEEEEGAQTEANQWDINEVLAAYSIKIEGLKRSLADSQELVQPMVEPPFETFFDRLQALLGEQQPNWIFDYQLKISRKMIFTHRLLPTFRLIVDYETVDDAETGIVVNYIGVEQATAIPLQRWTAFEHLLDFQLQLKLPVNLTSAIEGNSVVDFAQFLQCINAICVDIKRTFHKLLTVLTATRASLQRHANRMVIKKTVRRLIELDTHTRIDRTDFVIEIANVERVSFKDILQPKLHLFNENIQFLPKGVAFLEAFLIHPEQYLKA